MNAPGLFGTGAASCREVGKLNVRQSTRWDGESFRFVAPSVRIRGEDGQDLIADPAEHGA